MASTRPVFAALTCAVLAGCCGPREAGTLAPEAPGCPAGGGKGHDWPQWRGANRDAISPERITIWPPEVLWRAGVGNGVSSVIVAGGRLFAMGRRGEDDAVWCFDAATGRALWTHCYPALGDKTTDVKLPGPRSTPASDGRRLYTLSLEGRLHCLDAATGKVLWSRSPEQIGAFIGQYGLCCPLLLHGGMLVIDVNKHCVALDKTTGRELWRAPGGAGWNGAGPVAARVEGRPCVIYGTGRCVEAATGKTLWCVPYGEWSVMTPVICGDAVFLAPFHGRNLGGKGCAMLRMTLRGAAVLWHNDEVEGLCSTAVAWRGFLYAPDRDDLSIRGESGRKMNVKCIDLRSGQVRWVQRPISWPNLLIAGDKLLIQTLRGHLVLVDPTPAGYRELGRARLPRGRYWSSPALANGRLYCRSNTGEVTCLRVGAIAEPSARVPARRIGRTAGETRGVTLGGDLSQGDASWLPSIAAGS